MSEIRLLVTSAGSTASQGLLLELRRRPRSIRPFLVAADVKPLHGGLGIAERDVTIVGGSEPEYISKLEQLATQLRLDLIVPVFEPELRACSQHDSETLGGARLLLSGARTIDVCRSKRRLSEALTAAGVLSPDLVAEPGVGDLPLFARPDVGTGGQRARKISDARELLGALAGEGDLVFTRCLDGREISVDGFAWPAGTLRHAICRTRDEVKGGLAVRSTVVDGERARTLAAAVAAALELRGFFNLQYRETTGGESVFDVNPRLGGGMALSFRAGLDPLRCIRFALGLEEQDRPWKEAVGLTMVRRWQNVFLAR